MHKCPPTNNETTTTRTHDNQPVVKEADTSRKQCSEGLAVAVMARATEVIAAVVTTFTR